MANPSENTDTTVASPAWRSVAVWTVAVLVVIYSVSWFGTALLLKRQVAAWIAFQHTQGVTVTTTPFSIGGFPGRVHVFARDVTVAAPGWTWHGDKVRVKTRPLGLWRPTIDASGGQSLAGIATAPDMALWLNAAKAEVALRLDLGGRLTEAILTTADMNAGLVKDQPLLRLADGTVAFTLLKVPAPPADSPSPTLPASVRLTIDLKSLALPSPASVALPAPLDQPIARAAATLEITGPVTPGPLPQVLEAWRSGGGTLELREALLEWPPLHISGSGTLALDARLQPIGAFSTTFQGGAETLDALAKGGWMDADGAEAAKLGLILLSRKGADGATPEVKVPLTIQDQRLSAGPVTLATIPEIVWRPVAIP